MLLMRYATNGISASHDCENLDDALNFQFLFNAEYLLLPQNFQNQKQKHFTEKRIFTT